MKYRLEALQGITDKIRAIKAVRCLTGMGLKEAKDLIDDLGWKGAQVINTIDEDFIKTQYNTHSTVEFLGLSSCGISFTKIPDNGNLKTKVVDLVKEALDVENYQVADQLISILKGM